MANHTNRASNTADDGWLSRERALAIALVIFTAVIFYLCYRLLLPFLPALAWALALAVMAHPLHRRIQGWIPFPTIASALSVVIVVIVIVIPVIFVTQYVVREASNYAERAQQEFTSGRWRQTMAKYPRLKPVVRWIDTRVGQNLGIETPQEGEGQSESQSSGEQSQAAGSDQATSSASESTDEKSNQGGGQESNGDEPLPVSQSDSTAGTAEQSKDGLTAAEPVLPAGVAQVERAATAITQGVSSVLTGTFWILMQLGITVLSLFFFFRDRSRALGLLRSLMPLSHPEINKVFARVDDTIHATIYGSIVVAIIQGMMGGLMFWMLGLPSPLMWGSVMALLAVVPVLGTFVIWAPAALYLAFTGEWFKAIALAAWGACAIGLIDNFLYPFLVGKRLRFHTLVVFFAIVGGLALFGASGIILGPLIIAIADALLDVWRRRTALGGTLESGVQPTT